MYDNVENYYDDNLQIRHNSRYGRTMIRHREGSYSSGRIEMSTGVVAPYEYTKTLPLSKPVAGAPVCYVDGCGCLLSYTPHWITLKPLKGYDVEVTRKGKVRSTKGNSNNVYLTDYNTVGDATDDLPVLDTLLTGVSLLDTGNNTTPINKGLLFSMLRDIDNINVDTIRAYTGYSERYCYKLSALLRVLSTAFDREIEK